MVWSNENSPSTWAGVTCALSTAVPFVAASVPPAATGSSVAGSPASATAGAAAMEATMVNPARAEIVARPRCCFHYRTPYSTVDMNWVSYWQTRSAPSGVMLVVRMSNR